MNAIAPGVIETPMTRPTLESEEHRKALLARGPAPFNGPTGAPSAPAALLDWLTSTDNAYVTGQLVFIGGGAESILRPELI